MPLIRSVAKCAFITTSKIFETFPDLTIAFIAARGINNNGKTVKYFSDKPQ